MQTNIFSLIDELVKMSGSNNDFDTIESEIAVIDTEIPQIKADLEELSSSISDEKYFDASQEILDRNIEISVSKKLSKLEIEYDILKEKLVSLEKEEQKAFEGIDSLKQKIIRIKRNLSLIDERVNNSNNDDTKKLYNFILDEEQNKVIELQKELETKEINLKKLTDEISELNTLNQNTKNLIEQSTSRLLEVRRSLSDKSSYVDENLKHKDSEKIKELSSALEALESKKNTLVNDTSFLANNIKELIISKDNEKALTKLSELVLNIKKKPYMDINDKKSLNEELKKLEEEQKSLLIDIENKNYYGDDVHFIENRIKYLEDFNKTQKDVISELEHEINKIDNELVRKVSSELKLAENKAEELEKDISEANNMLNNKNTSTTTNSLKATLSRKNNELRIINNIIEKYMIELNALIEESTHLESIKLNNIKSKIESNDNEIKELEKLKLMSTKNKDILEQELDKQELKRLSENIKMISHRLNFDKSPDEIYDEIEMILNSESNNTKMKDNEENIESSIVLEEKIVNDTQSIETKINNEIPKTDIPLFENVEDFVENKNDNKEIETEPEYRLTELEDTNYFSLEEFLKGLEKEKE